MKMTIQPTFFAVDRFQPLTSSFAASLCHSGPSFVIPAKAGIQKGRGWVRPPDDEKNRPAYHHFHPLMRPAQGHGDSGEEAAPYPDTGPKSRGVVMGNTTRRWEKTDPSPHFHPPMRPTQGQW